MADVEVNQTPGSSANWVWAVIVLALVALAAWYFFAGDGARTSRANETKVEVTTPAGSGEVKATTP